jgi:predicted unusual protein kinase regulating ubiquinone biosynthesis (AarF/ABC1/UbiB family)
MTLSLKPESLRRYKDIIALLVKYGRSDLVQQANLAKIGGANSKALATIVVPKAEELASDLESLGATFIKLG